MARTDDHVPNNKSFTAADDNAVTAAAQMSRAAPPRAKVDWCAVIDPVTGHASFSAAGALWIGAVRCAFRLRCGSGEAASELIDAIDVQRMLDSTHAIVFADALLWEAVMRPRDKAGQHTRDAVDLPRSIILSPSTDDAYFLDGSVSTEAAKVRRLADAVLDAAGFVAPSENSSESNAAAASANNGNPPSALVVSGAAMLTSGLLPFASACRERLREMDKTARNPPGLHGAPLGTLLAWQSDCLTVRDPRLFDAIRRIMGDVEQACAAVGAGGIARPGPRLDPFASKAPPVVPRVPNLPRGVTLWRLHRWLWGSLPEVAQQRASMGLIPILDSWWSADESSNVAPAATETLLKSTPMELVKTCRGWAATVAAWLDPANRTYGAYAGAVTAITTLCIGDKRSVVAQIIFKAVWSKWRRRVLREYPALHAVNS
jgi:hypothetical protein